MKKEIADRMKQFMTGLLALAVVLSCACGKKEETEKTTKEKSEKTEEVSSEEPTEEPVTSEAPTDTETPSSDSESSSGPAQSSVNSSFRTKDAEDYMDSVTFDGVCLVAENDEVVWTYASGFADRENNVLNTMDTVFEFGSITKQFTAVAIMQLVEQGKISTEDKLDKYLPEYSHASEITIHQLLNMTSGVPDYLYCGVLGISLDFSDMDLSAIASLKDVLTPLVTTPIVPSEMPSKMSGYALNFTPGTQYEYSNTNYYFLGLIIEQLSGMTYDEYIRKNILEPLDLTELYPDIDHIDSNGRTDLTLVKFDFPHQDATISYAVGVMSGTAEGLLRWEECVMDGALLTEESWNKIFDGGAFGYGYGWYTCDGYVEHSGMTLGYNTNVIVDKENRRVVIVLSNLQPLTGTDSKPMSSDIGGHLWKDF